MGVQGAKPSEADGLLHVKGVIIKIMIMNIVKKYVNFSRGGGAADPPVSFV